jgi:hypothetical protein
MNSWTSKEALGRQLAPHSASLHDDILSDAGVEDAGRLIPVDGKVNVFFTSGFNRMFQSTMMDNTPLSFVIGKAKKAGAAGSVPITT